MDPISPEDYTNRIKEIVAEADLTQITFKSVRLQIESEKEISLQSVKKDFDALVRKILLEQSESLAKKVSSSPFPAPTTSTAKPPRPDPKPAASRGRKRKNPATTLSSETVNSDESDSYDFSGLTDEQIAQKLQKQEEKLRSRPSRSTATSKKKPRKSTKEPKQKNSTGGAKGGFSKELLLSPALAEVVGVKELSRPQTTKRLWDYIKEHNLQDPSNRSFVICDDKLKAVFETDRIHCFKMAKFVSAHLYDRAEICDGVVPAGRKEITEGSKPKKKTKSTTTTASGTRVRGIMKPALLSEPLAAICGTNEMPRTTVVKTLWDYVKSNGLQDPANKKVWICDEKLKTLFGVDRIDGFKMNKVLSKHIKTKNDVIGGDESGEDEQDDNEEQHTDSEEDGEEIAEEEKI
ncbi:hypothetical protein HK098_001400 [Nowakowskiella sp. JEL0407]|nr:hypothetical protein HK098_001400 [Nowakowskiella sp. JEL0407]